MVRFDGYNIELTRGDTLMMRIDLSGRDLPEGSQAVLTVKKNVRSEEKLICEWFDASEETLGICLLPEQTDLTPGVYVWDVRLRIPAENGSFEVFTPMDYAAFVVVDAVGDGTEAANE